MKILLNPMMCKSLESTAATYLTVKEVQERKGARKAAVGQRQLVKQQQTILITCQVRRKLGLELTC